MNKLITKETLEKWHACPEGAACFSALWPDGADLATASAGLIADGHKAWSDWLWWKCAKDSEYFQQTVITAGYRGCLVLKHYSEGRDFVRCANVGFDGIKPNTAYKLDDAGEKFVEVEK